MDTPHVRDWRPAMRTLCLFVAFGIAVSALGWRHASCSFVSEIPYEEGAFATAVEMANCDRGPSVTWSEHPALPVAAVSLLVRYTHGISCLQSARLISGALYVLGYCGIVALICLSTRGSRGHSDAFCGLFALSLFSMPGVLCHAFRASGESLAYAACAALLLSSRTLALCGGAMSCGCVTICALTLTWSTCYGWAFSAAIIIAYAVVLLSRAHLDALPEWQNTGRIASQAEGARVSDSRLWRIAGFLVAAVVVAGVMCMPSFQLGERFSALRGHYWAMPRAHSLYSIPLSFQVRLATDVKAIELPYMADCLWSALLLLMAIPCVIGKASCDTLALTIATAISSIVLVAADSVMGPLIVPHLLGVHLLLGALAVYFAIGDISRLGQVIFVAGMFIATVPPSTVSLFARPIRSDEYLERASRSIEHMKNDCDRILYAGSRTYIMLRPFRVTDDERQCQVYFRCGLWPDNFVARSLVPPESRLNEDDVSTLHGATVLYVQLEAAQSVRIDTSAWTIAKSELIAHPCNAIGNIRLIVLAPRVGSVIQESGSVTVCSSSQSNIRD